MRLNRDVLVRLAATAEQCSEHPIAKALLHEAEQLNIRLPILRMEDYVYSPGSGVKCLTKEGCVLVGNRTYMEANGLPVGPRVDACMWDLEIQGKSAVCLALDRHLIGVFGVADMLKPEACGSVQALRALNIDVCKLNMIVSIQYVHLYLFAVSD